MLDRLLSALNTLSQSLLLMSPSDFLKQVSEKACELLFVPICIVWKLDEEENKLKIVATNGDVDDEYKKIELNLHPGIEQHLFSRKVAHLLDR